MPAVIERIGLRPSIDSDAPICSLRPLQNLHAMITRTTSQGRADAREPATEPRGGAADLCQMRRVVAEGGV